MKKYNVKNTGDSIIGFYFGNEHHTIQNKSEQIIELNDLAVQELKDNYGSFGLEIEEAVINPINILEIDKEIEENSEKEVLEEVEIKKPKKGNK